MGKRRISPTYSGFRGGFVGLAAGGWGIATYFLGSRGREINLSGEMNERIANITNT